MTRARIFSELSPLSLLESSYEILGGHARKTVVMFFLGTTEENGALNDAVVDLIL